MRVRPDEGTESTHTWHRMEKKLMVKGRVTSTAGLDVRTAKGRLSLYTDFDRAKVAHVGVPMQQSLCRTVCQSRFR